MYLARPLISAPSRIHGGSFVAGSASDQALDGTTLASEGTMIVVTMQYRLGMLGLLRAPEEGVQGNMAVLDAIESLSELLSTLSSCGIMCSGCLSV